MTGDEERVLAARSFAGDKIMQTRLRPYASINAATCSFFSLSICSWEVTNFALPSCVNFHGR